MDRKKLRDLQSLLKTYLTPVEAPEELDEYVWTILPGYEGRTRMKIVRHNWYKLPIVIKDITIVDYEIEPLKLESSFDSSHYDFCTRCNRMDRTYMDREEILLDTPEYRMVMEIMRKMEDSDD